MTQFILSTIKMRLPFTFLLVGVALTLTLSTVGKTIPNNLSNLHWLANSSTLWNTSTADWFTPCADDPPRNAADLIPGSPVSRAILGALRVDCIYGLGSWNYSYRRSSSVDAFWAGVILARNDRQTEAIAIWQQAHASSFFLTNATASRQSYDAMRYWADWLFQIAPDNWRYRYLYGILLLSHDPALAEEFFLQSMQLNPSQTESALELGLHYYAHNEDRKAVRWCGSVFHIAPHNFLASECLALASFRLGDWQTAEVGFRASIQERPDSTYNQLMLGWSLRQLDRKDEVEPFFRKATEIAQAREWDLAARAWYELGRYYQEHGLNKEAMEAYRESLQIDPDSLFFSYGQEIHTAIGALESEQ